MPSKLGNFNPQEAAEFIVSLDLLMKDFQDALSILVKASCAPAKDEAQHLMSIKHINDFIDHSKATVFLVEIARFRKERKSA